MSSTDFAGIERGVGILEDDLHLAQLVARALACAAAKFLAIEDDLADGGRQDAGNGAGERRLSATGFADDAEIAALFHLEAHMLDGAHEWQPVALTLAVTGDKVFDLRRGAGRGLGRIGTRSRGFGSKAASSSRV